MQSKQKCARTDVDVSESVGDFKGLVEYDDIVIVDSFVVRFEDD